MKTRAFLAALAISTAATAQQLNYQHGTLTDTYKLVMSKGKEVNIRKTASNSAPKLWHGCMDETDDCAFMWSNDMLEGYESEPFILFGDDCILTTGESGAFYKVQVGPAEDNVTGFIAKSAVKEFKAETITLDDVRADKENFTVIEDGPYQGLIIMHESDEAWGVANILLGTLEDDKMVFTHRTIGRFNQAFEDGTENFEYGEGDNFITFGKNYTKTIKNEDYEMNKFDISKLTQQELYTMLKKLGAEDKPNHLDVYVKQEDGFTRVLSKDVDAKTPLNIKSKKMGM